MDSDEMTIQKKFLEHVNLFNEVVMSNKIIFSINLKKKYLKQKIIQTDKSSIIVNYPWENDMFYVYICKKAEEMQKSIMEYKDELSFYYSHYKRKYNSCSIIVIVVSSCIPLVEGISLCFEPVVATNILVLILGTLVSVLTSLLKFLNYKNKMEEIVRIREKINTCEAKIFYFDKRLKSKLYVIHSQEVFKKENTLENKDEEGTN